MSPIAARITLRGLAQDLGVSAATVSNAYNRPDQLSPALRERILARALELGFSGPDPVARGLRRGRVGAVGVLVDQSVSYAFSDPAVVLILDGLARELGEAGFGLLLHAAAATDTSAPLVRAAAVDAWVLMSVPAGTPAVQVARSQGRPLVVLDQPELPDVPRVTADDEGGSAAAAAHLVGLGHRRIAVLTTALHDQGRLGLADADRQAGTTRTIMGRRLAGVRGTLAQAGIAWEDVTVVECGTNDEDAGAAGAVLAVDAQPATTALLCLTDQLALGALRLLRETDVPVPRSMSVTGFDDAPAARTAFPPLTTVVQPLRQRGAALGQLVRALLDGRDTGDTGDTGGVPSPPTFPTGLVVRDSTARPRTGAPPPAG